MRRLSVKNVIVFTFSGLLLSCNSPKNQDIALLTVASSSEKPLEESRNLSQEFKDYWYAGTAEITSYNLKQARYGEIHQGTAVTVFVTEDFLPGR